MIAVIGGYPAEFDKILKDSFMRDDHSQFKFISSMEDIKNVQFKQVIRLSSSVDLPNANKIYSAVRKIIRDGT